MMERDSGEPGLMYLIHKILECPIALNKVYIVMQAKTTNLSKSWALPLIDVD